MTGRPGELARANWSWFPLVNRPRPPARPLRARTEELTRLARQLMQAPRIATAAEICNKSALIASDCGVPDLALDLSWAQHHLLTSSPGEAPGVADLAVQPLLNIARQHLRDGRAAEAYGMLDALFRAARQRADITID